MNIPTKEYKQLLQEVGWDGYGEWREFFTTITKLPEEKKAELKTKFRIFHAKYKLLGPTAKAATDDHWTLAKSLRIYRFLDTGHDLGFEK